MYVCPTIFLLPSKWMSIAARAGCVDIHILSGEVKKHRSRERWKRRGAGTSRDGEAKQMSEKG